MNRWIRQSLLAALVLSVGGAAFWLGRDWRSGNTSEPTTALTSIAGGDADEITVQVRVQTLRQGTLRQAVDAYGTVGPIPGASTGVPAPSDAVVKRILVRQGETVTEITPVVELGPTAETQLQFRQAQDASDATRRNAEETRQRLAEHLATNADVSVAEQAERAANTQLASLKERGVGGTRQLLAGSAGRIAQVSVQAGQVVSAGTALVTIDPFRALEAIVGLESIDADHVATGDEVQIRDVHATDDLPPVVGTVRMIAASINAQSRMRDVSVTLPKDATFVSGMFVTARVMTGEATGWIVPRSAVVPTEDGDALFVEHDGKAARHAVRVLLRSQDEVLVEGDDLRAGDPAIVSGNSELEDGMSVHIETPTTAPDPEKP